MIVRVAKYSVLGRCVNYEVNLRNFCKKLRKPVGFSHPREFAWFTLSTL